METVQYLRALGRSWFIVILTLIAGGVGGYLYYAQATPRYESIVHMIVSGAGNGRASDEVTSRVLATQRALALSQVAGTAPAIKAAAAAAGYPADSPSVSASADDKGPFLNISVIDSNATRAQAIANSFAGTLPDTMVKLEGPSDSQLALSNLAPASYPGSPVSPKLLNDLALGLAAGLILGVAIALLREVIDRTIRDTDELEKLTELTIFGTVPRDSLKSSLPARTNPRSARAEAYRQIRTTILNARTPTRTLAVTSASLGEGKTSVACNVAAVFARAGHRVAIVDADLRRPRVADVFEIRRGPGLAEVLARRVPLHDAMVILDDGRLGVLTAGQIPANPSEALGGAMTEKVLEQLTADYEYVFVDTPPVLPVTDALVVAPMVDGVLLVTRLGRTTRERVKRAMAAVRRVNATVIGVVPNHAGSGADREYRYGYRYTGSHKKGAGAPKEIDASLFRPSAGSMPPPSGSMPPPSEREFARTAQRPPEYVNAEQPAAPSAPMLPPPPMQPPFQGPPMQGPPQQEPPAQPPFQGPPMQGPPMQGPPQQEPPAQLPFQGPPAQRAPTQEPPMQVPPEQQPAESNDQQPAMFQKLPPESAPPPQPQDAEQQPGGPNHGADAAQAAEVQPAPEAIPVGPPAVFYPQPVLQPPPLFPPPPPFAPPPTDEAAQD